MINRCPNCQKRLPRKSTTCKACGWSLGVDLDQPIEVEVVDDAIVTPKSASEMHVQSAIDSITRQNFSEALNSLNRAIVDAPPRDLAEIYSLRGYSYLMLDDFRRAEADCTTAIEKRGPDSETLAWRAAARGHQNRWRAALEDLTDAHVLANSGEDEYSQLIDTYRVEATRYFGELVQQGKSDPELFCHRGWVYLLVDNLEKAKRDFQLALHRDPNHQWALLGQAEVDVRENKHARAQEVCEKLRALNIDEKTFQRSLLKTEVRAWAGNQQVELAIENLTALRKESESHSLRLLDCGRLAMNIGDFVSAIDDFTKILKDHPQFITAWRLRGKSFAAINNFQSAENDFSEAIDILEHNCDATLFCLRGEMRLAQKKIEEALEDFDAALEFDNIKPRAFLSRARAYQQQDNFEMALEECEKAIRLDNALADAHFVRGEIKFDSHQFTAAIDDFQQAIQLAKAPEQLGKYHYHLGAAHYEKGDPTSAAAEFLKAEELRPNHAGTQVWKAATFAQLGQWADAIASLQQAIAVRPAAAVQYHQLGRPVAKRALEFFDQQLKSKKPSADLVTHRGLAFQFLGDFQSALENFERAVELGTNDKNVPIRLAQMQAKLNEHQAAARTLTKLLEAHPDEHVALYHRASSLGSLKKTELAWKDICRAIELRSDQPRYFLLKGELLQQRNKHSSAIQALTQAAALDSSDSMTLRQRGVSFAAAGQYHKAIGDFTRSLELNPLQTDVFVLRGNAHFKNGHLDQAKEDFEIALTRNETLPRAFTGRAMVLAAQGQHESAVIWLTKAFHRFKEARPLSELMLTRGKIFFQMGRFLPSINDFSAVMELQRENNQALAAARYGRALALVQQGELTKAEVDFKKVVSINPTHRGAEEALRWIQAGDGPRPNCLAPPSQLIRPHRPSRKRKPIELVDIGEKWESGLPHSDWIIRHNGKIRREYGPVTKHTLDQWCREGRIEPSTRLLRSDWKKWRKAAYVYPELMPSQAQPTAEDDSDTPPREVNIQTRANPSASISSMPVIETNDTPDGEQSE